MLYIILITYLLIALKLPQYCFAQKKIDDSDVNLERIYQQWEDNDEDPLSDDELPDYAKKIKPTIDLSKLDMNNPNDILKQSAKGKTIMMFVSTTDTSKQDAEITTQLWQGSLYNKHVDVQRYMIDDNRAIFVFNKGDQAWESIDFFKDQEKCDNIRIDNQEFFGKGHKKLSTEPTKMEL